MSDEQRAIDDGLRIEGVTAGYGAVPVLEDVCLTVPPGQVVAVLGPNGAGKTTLLKTISGIVRPRQGTITYNRADLFERGSSTAAASGIAHVPEGRRVFSRRTVEENILLGGWVRRREAGLHASRDEMLERFPQLGARRHQLAGSLSGGEAQMLAIAMALVARPSLVMLDEPSQGLAPLVVDSVFAEISELRRQGLSVLIVEQSASRSLPLADVAHVLSLGRIVVSGPPEELSENAEFRDAYLGI